MLRSLHGRKLLKLFLVTWVMLVRLKNIIRKSLKREFERACLITFFVYHASSATHLVHGIKRTSENGLLTA